MKLSTPARPPRPSRHATVCMAVFLLFALAGFGLAWAAHKVESTRHEHDVKIDSSYDDWLDRTASLTSGSVTAGVPPPVVRIG